eukprot:scaffold28598_cov128-Skeletonema_marinoi.AAC.1
MFVGTILHSLDHSLMDWNLKDPLWLDVDDPRFGKMAELGRVVKVGFVSDIPGLYFHKRYKGSGHPFYEAVYRKAAKINKNIHDIPRSELRSLVFMSGEVRNGTEWSSRTLIIIVSLVNLYMLMNLSKTTYVRQCNKYTGLLYLYDGDDA